MDWWRSMTKAPSISGGVRNFAFLRLSFGIVVRFRGILPEWIGRVKFRRRSTRVWSLSVVFTGFGGATGIVDSEVTRSLAEQTSPFSFSPFSQFLVVEVNFFGNEPRLNENEHGLGIYRQRIRTNRILFIEDLLGKSLVIFRARYLHCERTLFTMFFVTSTVLCYF